MKKIFTILCSLCIGTFAFGQLVPNGGFEDGAVNWQGINTSLVASINVTNSSGTETLMPVNGVRLAFMQSTTSTAALFQKFAYTQRPNSFRFMFCYLPAGAGEAALALVRFTKYNSMTMKVDTLLSVNVLINAASYPWREAIIELGDKYKMAGNPDTAYIFITNSATATRLQGTALVLDNIKFSANSASASEIDKAIVGVPTLSPNPMADQATIHFQTNTSSDVKIELYDMTGKMVKEILNEKLAYGNHTADVNATGLNAGMYFYKISTGSYTTTEKIIISR